MAEITAAAVKALREKTGLPMMDCKKALEQAGGDEETAIRHLREQGKKWGETKAGRETAFGRFATHARLDEPVGTMIELLCESAPVAGNEEFVALGQDLADALALTTAASTGEALLALPSPRRAPATLREQFDELNNRIREVFRVGRIVRIDGRCGSYVHHNGSVGVLLQVEGGTAEAVKDVCMHIAFAKPKAIGPADLDPQLVQQERDIQTERARNEGKPENIIPKMIEGRMKSFYAENCLLEQPFVKDAAKTVGQVAKEAGMKIVRFVHWEIGKG